MDHTAQSLHTYTPKQGQYLAFIYAYTLVNGYAPAQADMQRFFKVTPPSVHQMILALEKAGLISRQPGKARSVSILVDHNLLPRLEPVEDRTVKSSVMRY